MIIGFDYTEKIKKSGFKIVPGKKYIFKYKDLTGRFTQGKEYTVTRWSGQFAYVINNYGIDIGFSKCCFYDNFEEKV